MVEPGALASFDDLLKLDIRVGTVARAEVFEKARKPAYKLWVDYGPGIGVLKSSAQITEWYTPDTLLGRQVLGVVNFPPRQIADFMSEALVLGVYAEGGVVLVGPQQPVENGSRLG